MKNVQYSPTITFGNILSLIGMLGTLIGLYITHDRRITILEGQNASIGIVVSKISISQEANTRALDRLTYIIEDRSIKQ